jgi:hypothetical protein
MPLDALQERITQTALALPEARTLALAGGGPMIAHGLVDRVTHDVDLFTEIDPDEAVHVATALRKALVSAGLQITPAARPPHTNRFVVHDPIGGLSCEVEVFPDGGRLRPTVRLAVGPVLHLDDLAADKVLALWGRAEVRDYIDVVALLDRYLGDAVIHRDHRGHSRLVIEQSTLTKQVDRPTHCKEQCRSVLIDVEHLRPAGAEDEDMTCGFALAEELGAPGEATDAAQREEAGPTRLRKQVQKADIDSDIHGIPRHTCT